MPETATVTLPDGRTATVTGPDRETVLARIDALRGEQKQQAGFATRLAQRFNKGLSDLFLMPSDLVNVGLEQYRSTAQKAGVSEALGIGEDAYRLPTEQFRERTAQSGITPQVGAEPEGFLERSAEIAGGSVLPLAGMLSRGQKILNAGISEPNRTAIQQLFAQTAKSPGRAVVSDVAGSAGAGFGGEVSSNISNDPAIIALGELAGGFAPAAVVAGPTARASRYVVGKVRENVTPFTEAGAMPRAARRLQSLSADPESAAARIADTEFAVGVSPARRTGERRLLELERKVLDEDPALDAKFSEDLAAASQKIRQQATQFDGEPSRPRELLRKGRDYLVNLVNVRATQAARNAAEAVAALGSDATPRQISKVAREHVDQAYSEARLAESQLWDQIDRAAPASFANARERLSAEISSRSKFDDPDEIPGWIRAALKKDGVTFNDVHAVRKRLRRSIAQERAEAAPNRNKVRILSDIEEGLLDDMAATNAEGVEAARAFSRTLNEKFTQGAVGRLLGHERAGGSSVAPEDTLTRILQGSASATSVQQFLKAAPRAKPQLEQFIKSTFLLQAAEPSSVNPAAANRFLANMRKSGVLGIFPELEAELKGVTSLAQGARRLGVRAESIDRLAHHSQKSRAALYLNAPPGQEMDAVLRARNPRAVATSLVRRMKGDKQAIQGLKTSFVETLMIRSETGRFTETGDPIVSGARFFRLLNDYQGEAKALGMTEPEMARLNRIAQTLRQIEQPPTGAAKDIIEDTPSYVLDVMARVIGAQYGGKIGSNTGSSLQGAQIFSKRLRDMLGRVTRDRAQAIVIAAHSDPELYRALLTRPTDSAAKQQRAANRLNAWLLGVAAQSDVAPEAEENP